MQYTNMSKAFYLTTDEYLSLIKQGLNQYFPDDSQPNHPEVLHMKTINVLCDLYIERYYGSLNNNVEVDSNDSEDYDEEDDEDIN